MGGIEGGVLMKVKTKGHKKAKINISDCDGNPWCPSMRACPVNAIKIKEKKGSFIFKRVVLEIDSDACTGCSKCVKYCAHKAIYMK